MAGAVIAIDQDQGTLSSGSPGVARKDLWQGRLVTLRSTLSGNGSYAWTLLDKPPGSASTLSGAGTDTATFTPDLPGSYRVQLLTNGGGAGNAQVLISAVRFDHGGALVNRGWRPPALGETSAEDNFAGQQRGWAEAVEFILADLLANFGVGAPAYPLEVPLVAGLQAVGPGSALRVGARSLILGASGYPDAFGPKNRVVKFKCFAGASSGGLTTTVLLRDVTLNTTLATFTTSSTGGAFFDSGALSLTGGDVFEVTLATSGSDMTNDRANLWSARFEITYV